MSRIAPIVAVVRLLGFGEIPQVQGQGRVGQARLLYSHLIKVDMKWTMCPEMKP